MSGSCDTPAMRPENRLGLDYRAEAQRFTKHDFPIVDVHSHISGGRAAELYGEAAQLYGVELTYSMTPLEEVAAVSEGLDGRVRFIAIPDFYADDRRYALAEGYADRIKAFADKGAEIAKFWSAPRGVDFALMAKAPANSFRLDAPHVRRNIELAIDLGMHIMVHIGDPDTWFATQYKDKKRYGTKLDQYGPLEARLQEFPDTTFIAAHMGGWPERLEFLSEMLERHSNLFLDSSATKWIVRSFSKHPREALVAFFNRWRGRILFGSDIVTRDGHLDVDGADDEDRKVNGPSQAFDLYASRYWALRTLFESTHNGPSPIADPDLMLVDPEKYTELDAPLLVGKQFPASALKTLYFDAWNGLLSGSA